MLCANNEKIRIWRMNVSIIIPFHNRLCEVIECVKSVLESSYKDKEVIVVDNGSNDAAAESLQREFGGKIKIVRSEVNLGAGGGRNLGASKANGKYLLFVDSDNVIDKKMIGYLADFMEKGRDGSTPFTIGMAGPLMLYKKYPNLIWLYFADINMWTSQATYKGTGEADVRQYKEVLEVGHIPNCFMVRADDFRIVGGFDEKYFIMYEEADLAEKFKRMGKKVYICTKARTYHDIPVRSEKVTVGPGLRSSERAFLTARNRVYFMKKNANFVNKFIFFVMFLPISVNYYMVSMLLNRQYASVLSYLRGTLAGILM